MSVTLKSNSSSKRQVCARDLCAKPSAACLEKVSKTLNIGLVNNMPDAALEATERQFMSLLASASDGFAIELSLYSLPGVPRSEAAAGRVSECYAGVENLLGLQLDGVIVTGREPLIQNLAEEPYWESFTKLVDWAERNTYSSIWSCLAAHAAVLYMDGIARVRNGHKYSGIFDCVPMDQHPLLAGRPSQFKLPHSRWNGLKEDELTRCGYHVISKAADAGVDTFVKEGKSLFVFFQGHPEYEANALLLEYRRDIGRYLRNETSIYPVMPRNYFNDETAAALMALEQRAKSGARAETMSEVSSVLENVDIEATWHSIAVGIYRNWLQEISARKKLQLERDRVNVETIEEVPALTGAEVSRADPYAGPSTTLTASRNTLTIL